MRPAPIRLAPSVLLLAALLSTVAAAQRGIQVNVDPVTGLDIVGDAGNEPSLAISPVDPRQVVIGWRWFANVGSDSRTAGFAWSTDGGATFRSGGSLTPPPGWPATAEQTDPVLSVDAQGRFYYWSEVFRPSFGQYVYQSTDGGRTWPVVAPVENPSTSGDKGWLVIDRTHSLGRGHLYGGWNNFTLGGQCFVRSVDGGATFSPAVRIADRGGTQWMLHFATGPDGELYAAWRHYADNAIYVTKSLSARDPLLTPTFDAFGSGGVNGQDLKIDDGNDPGFLPVNPVGFHQIYLDVDRSAGPYRGQVYCLWADDRRDVCDIFFARSLDGGQTWLTGTRINDDLPGNGAYQWMPAMSVAPNGRIDAVWYDTRNHLRRPRLSELYTSFSVDGGATWSVNRRLSESFDTTIGWPSQQKIGDYIQTVSQEQVMSVAYAATFQGGQDVYYMGVRPTLLRAAITRRNGPGRGPVLNATVTGATPNRPLWLFASLQQGRTYLPGLNSTLGLAGPLLAEVFAMTDATGRAQLSLTLPKVEAPVPLLLQAAQQEGGSNLVPVALQ